MKDILISIRKAQSDLYFI